MYDRTRSPETWLMLAGASLAGGATAKQAVDNADMVVSAAKDRFPEEKDDDR